MTIHTLRVERDEHMIRFLVGDHVVAEWRDDGEGVNGDNVLVETPALRYFETTTATDRCARIAFALVHWEVLSALLAGPGDGKLRQICEVYGDDDFCEICGRGGDDDRR